MTPRFFPEQLERSNCHELKFKKDWKKAQERRSEVEFQDMSIEVPIKRPGEDVEQRIEPMRANFISDH